MSYTPLQDKPFVGDGTTTTTTTTTTTSSNTATTDLDDIALTSRSIKINKSMNDTIDDEFRQSLSEPLTTAVLNGVSNSTGNTNTNTNTQQQHQLPQLSADPFYVFRDDLYRQLARVDESLTEYLRVVHQTDSAVNTHEVKEAKKQLKRSIAHAESTLQDLSMTVSLVENDRAKFRHIDDQELYDRSSLVNTSRDRIGRAKNEMNSEGVKAKLLQDERSKAIRRAGATVLGARNDSERVNTNMIVDAQARQSLLVQHQDETLDELDMAVTRVNTMAGMMHEEISQQNVMLNEMEEDLTNVEEELGMVMGKLAKFLKTKDTWQLGTILCLAVTCIILFFMVLYF